MFTTAASLGTGMKIVTEIFRLGEKLPGCPIEMWFG